VLELGTPVESWGQLELEGSGYAVGDIGLGG